VEKDRRELLKLGGYMIHIRIGVIQDNYKCRDKCFASMSNSPLHCNINGSSASSNAEVIVRNDRAYLRATKKIEIGDEILLHYGSTYRDYGPK
jgi:hypothetical protein